MWNTGRSFGAQIMWVMGLEVTMPNPFEWVVLIIGALGILALVGWRIKQYRDKGRWIKSESVDQITQTDKSGTKIGRLMQTAVMARYDMPLPSKDQNSQPAIFRVDV
ncbi:MAG: hypothetical protein LBB58_06525 [Cellulomonadaceae bacterium]|jgi:hypothetical protein|nr:hypothetical protein [Cellulomonadaceae bacterium]